jgi:hypothetical protein
MVSFRDANTHIERLIRIGEVKQLRLPNVNEIKYYDLRKKWKKVKRHLENPRVADTLVRDFTKVTYGKWRNRFTAGQVPFEFENCDWWIEHRGRHPQFWKYVKHGASHWLVNFALELAQLVEPDRKWRIITDKHSTVWDGEDTLFEFNFLAFGIPPKQCFELAYEHELKPGQHRKCGYPDHYTVEMKQLARDRARLLGTSQPVTMTALAVNRSNTGSVT